MVFIESSADPMRDTSTKGNFVIDMLPASAYGRLEQRLETVYLNVGQVLFEADADAPIDAAYFPLGPIVSLDQRVDDDGNDGRTTASVALTGNEGIIGWESLLGGESAINRATVRVAGSALRIEAGALRAEFARGTAMQRLLLAAADALFAQISANSGCERLHSPVQRLTRWLLLADDRALQRDLSLTQETLAQLLGVRRESVSVAARKLQRSGLIAYSRGTLVIVDREGLEARSCLCYRSIKRRYDAMREPAGLIQPH